MTTAVQANTFINAIDEQINEPTSEFNTIVLHFKYVCNAIKCGFNFSYHSRRDFIQYNNNDIHLFVIKWLVFQIFQVPIPDDNLNNTIDTFTNACKAINSLLEEENIDEVKYKYMINFCELMLNTLLSVKASQEDVIETYEDEVDVVVDINQSRKTYVNTLFNLEILLQDPDNNDGDFWTNNNENILKLIYYNTEILKLLFPGIDWDEDGYPAWDEDGYPTDVEIRAKLVIIFTDAVGTDNANNLFQYLRQRDYNNIDFKEISIMIALLQSLLESLILRLDYDELGQFAEIVDIQHGGGKKKSAIIFDGPLVHKITEQFNSNSRNARIRAKIKELFASANDSLPQYYIDAVLGGPSYANVLSWEFDYHKEALFNGFFANIPEKKINNYNNSEDLIDLIKAAVVSPLIPEILLEQLSQNDFNNDFNTGFDETAQHMQVLNIFLADRNVTTLAVSLAPLKIPFLFNQNDDDSSVFVIFEYQYMYLLKCVIIYSKIHSTLDSNIDITPFVVLLYSCTELYLKMVAQGVRIMNVPTEFTNKQKICTGYCLGGILQSVMTPLKPLLDQFANSALLSIETTEITRILSSKASVGRSKLQNAAFGDADTKLYNKFIKWVETTYMPRRDAEFHSNDKLIGPLINDFVEIDESGNQVLKGNFVTLVDALQSKGPEKFYINNAVSAPSALGKENSNFFCPISSVMDNMPTCSTIDSAKLKNGLETGNMDVKIRDPNNIITYRIRVVVDDYVARIAAYVKINKEVLINMGDEYTSAGTTWPGGSNPAILVNLNGGNPNPMDAKTCLKNIFKTYSNILTNYNNPSYEVLLDVLSEPQGAQLRRMILEASFQKSLGDILQELTGVAGNGGYTGNYQISPEIISQQNVRLQLNNDRPSAVRALLLILYATEGINPQANAGFMTEWKDKKKISISKYALAGKKQLGGGKPKKAKKTKKKRKQKKHTKKLKYRKKSTKSPRKTEKKRK